MKIKLVEMDDEFYFSLVVNEKTCYGASEMISKALGLNIDKYNKILIKEVIQHDNYRIEKNKYDILYKDVTFKKGLVPDAVYLKRFKEAFHKELILFSLGGEFEHEVWY